MLADDHVFFLGGPGGLFRYKQGTDKSAVRISSVPADRVTSLHLDGRNLFIGTERNGLYYLDIYSTGARKIAYEANSMGNQVSAITSDEQYIYLGTRDGIYVFNKDLSVNAHYTTKEGLPHNNIEHILLDNSGRLLFATRTRASCS